MGDDGSVDKSLHTMSRADVGSRQAERDNLPREKMLYCSGNSSSCFTCFISLRLGSVMNGSDGPLTNVLATSTAEPTMHILWSYPLSAIDVHKQYPNLYIFAAASAATSYSADHFFYTFVLTDERGVRQYGHSTPFVNGETVVVISPYPWCNFFYRLAALYYRNGDESGRRIVQELYQSHTPPSGATFLTPLNLCVTLVRPYDRLCYFIDSSPLDLLAVFPRMDTLFRVLADLLLEKHIVIVGPNFSIVSNVIMSLQALIAPFEWMHILIPILPSSLIEVLGAPLPYLVGLLSSQLPEASHVSVDRLVAVHLGADGVCERVDYIGEERDQLPHSGPLSALRIGLSMLKMRRPQDQSARDLCSLFMTYYAALFGAFLLKGHRGPINDPKLSNESTSFLRKMMSSQSYNVLSEEVSGAIQCDDLVHWMDNEFIVAAVRAHPSAAPYHYEQLVAEETQGKGYLERYGDCFGSLEEFTGLTAAVHGFGGHRLSVSRLVTRCLCGRWCRDASEEDHNHFQGSMRQAIRLRRYRSTPGDAPVILDIDNAFELSDMPNGRQ